MNILKLVCIFVYKRKSNKPEVKSCKQIEPSIQFIPATMAAIKLLFPAPTGPSIQTKSPWRNNKN